MKKAGNIPDRATRLTQGANWVVVAVPSLSDPMYFSLKLAALVPVEGRANYSLGGYAAIDGEARRAGRVYNTDAKILKLTRPLVYDTVMPQLNKLAQQFAATYKPDITPDEGTF